MIEHPDGHQVQLVVPRIGCVTVELGGPDHEDRVSVAAVPEAELPGADNELTVLRMASETLATALEAAEHRRAVDRLIERTRGE